MTKTDDPQSALEWLVTIPGKPAYKGMPPTKAYATHGFNLIAMAQDAEQHAVPVGSAAHQRLLQSAQETRRRAKLCELVADGQSPPAAVATVFNTNLEQPAKTPTGLDTEALRYLVGCPATDPAFIAAVEIANMETIEAAMKDLSVTLAVRTALIQRRNHLVTEANAAKAALKAAKPKTKTAKRSKRA